MEYTFDKNLPTHIKYVEGENGSVHVEFIYCEKNARKRINLGQQKVIEYLQAAGCNVRIAVNGDFATLVSPSEYNTGNYTAIPDPALKLSTIANYKTKLKQVRAEILLEEDPNKKEELIMFCKRLEDALGIPPSLRHEIPPLGKFTPPPYMNEEARKKRMEELIAAGDKNLQQLEETLNGSNSGLEELAKLLDEDHKKTERASQQVQLRNQE